MKRPTCGTCPHYVANATAIKEGTCRLNPPVVHIIMTQRGPMTPAAFPGVGYDEPGCSHHPQIGSGIGLAQVMRT